jgi:hypothetical protein
MEFIDDAQPKGNRRGFHELAGQRCSDITSRAKWSMRQFLLRRAVFTGPYMGRRCNAQNKPFIFHRDESGESLWRSHDNPPTLSYRMFRHEGDYNFSAFSRIYGRQYRESCCKVYTQSIRADVTFARAGGTVTERSMTRCTLKARHVSGLRENGNSGGLHIGLGMNSHNT